MDTWIKFGLLLIVSYLLGSVPSSYLVARSRGIDLRKQGTQQVGGGNLWRTTSRKLGLMVGLFDFTKGMLMVLIAAKLAHLPAYQQLVVGLAAVVGHNWPVFLRFHGGRGAATSLGIVIIMPVLNDLSPWPSIIGVGTVVFVTLILHSSALPVLFAAASMPLTTWFFNEKLAVILAYLAMFLILVLKRLAAQPMSEVIEISKGRLLLNRFLFDRDIGDRKTWVHRKHIAKKEKTE
jgi:glycerol-3-phosphate acyltransferase PlsY